VSQILGPWLRDRSSESVLPQSTARRGRKSCSDTGRRVSHQTIPQDDYTIVSTMVYWMAFVARPSLKHNVSLVAWVPGDLQILLQKSESCWQCSVSPTLRGKARSELGDTYDPPGYVGSPVQTSTDMSSQSFSYPYIKSMPERD
jgi:hypothetical protein